MPVLLLGAQGDDGAAKRQEQGGGLELLEAPDGAAESESSSRRRRRRRRLLGRGGEGELSAEQVQELALCRAGGGEADGLLGDVPGVGEGAVVGWVVGDELELELLGLDVFGGLASQEERGGGGGGGGGVGSLLGGLHWFEWLWADGFAGEGLLSRDADVHCFFFFLLFYFGGESL